MSKQPITHCEHGIDRAYRCIDCIESERDQLRARVEKLEIEREAQRSCAIYWMDQEDALRASIVALTERWAAMAKNHDHLMRITDSSVIMAEHRTAAHMFREHATELRQLVEGNGRD